VAPKLLHHRRAIERILRRVMEHMQPHKSEIKVAKHRTDRPHRLLSTFDIGCRD
jgi:hypothetical protein